MGKNEVFASPKSCSRRSFGVFTKLAARRLTGAELGAELQLHPRAIADFFDALVAMKFLCREGDGPQAQYFNTPEGALFLDE